MGDIITNAEYPQVRAAIGTDITPQKLPDALLDMDIYSGAAERWAKLLDPRWNDRTGAQEQALHSAVVLKLASLSILAIPMIVQESFGEGEGFRRAEVKPTERAHALEELAAAQINAYLAAENTPLVIISPRHFVTARGQRGR